MLKENRTLGGELRNQLVATVTEMLEKDDRIMVLDADLGGASFFLRFKKSHPDRFVDCGICEANMVGVAAGLSLRGYIPVVHTMSAFVARRALDQLYISCAYQNNTINVFGSDPGICSGFPDVSGVTDGSPEATTSGVSSGAGLLLIADPDTTLLPAVS